MTDNGDQAALNGLVDDCYGGEWPWAKYDHWITGKTKGNTPIIDIVHRIVTKADGTKTLHGYSWISEVNKTVYPLAGTWVEGRLRELIGEAFLGLNIDKDGAYWCVSKFGPISGIGHKGPTPITALVAALRVLKQKEVGGDS